MDKSFEAKVTEITRPEYMSALRWLQMARERNLILLVVVACGGLYLFSKNRNPAVLLIGIAVVAVVVGYFEISHLRDFKKFPQNLELTYEIDSLGWRLRVGEDSAVCAWANMVKMVETKTVFLLYASKSASNLLPKRCLTEEQIGQIQYWYKNRMNLTAHDRADEEEDVEDEIEVIGEDEEV